MVPVQSLGQRYWGSPQCFSYCEPCCCDVGCKYLFEALLSIILGRYPDVGWLDPGVFVRISNLLGHLHSFHHTAPFHFPTSCARGSSFSTASLTLGFTFYVFNYSHPEA